MARHPFRRLSALVLLVPLAMALAAAPALAQGTGGAGRQKPPKDQAAADKALGLDKFPLQDAQDHAKRKDTVVLKPKDGETISVKVPLQGQLYIVSQIPWAVTDTKPAKDFIVSYDVRGFEVLHRTKNTAKATFTLRLVDGRRITINVGTTKARYQVGYAVIT